MILDCPSCGTRFLIDPGLIGAQGRSVRCGSCGHRWKQAPPSAESRRQEPAESEASIPPLREFDEARRRSALEEKKSAITATATAATSQRLILGGWVLFAVVVLALMAGVIFAREQIMARWPGSGALYATVGLVAPESEAKIGEGLELRNITSVMGQIDGEEALLIEGVVVNVSDGPRPVPLLRASFNDSSGAELMYWTFSANSATLPPGGETLFQTSAKEPPEDGARINLIFVAPE